jgi:1-acyl-sn-glycerol-3-phosphate acyltransferase
VSELRYPVPWDIIFRLTPYIARGTPAPTPVLLRSLLERMQPRPLYAGLEHIPPAPPFVLAANHYQRRHLWIAHAAAALAEPLRLRFCSTPVRWIVTSNWPPLVLGPLRIPSPGDWLLPRVAAALGYYSVPFAASRPGRTASSLRRLLRDAPSSIVGIFPEGARATTGPLSPPLPGLDRLFLHLARAGLAVLPARVSESGSRFLIRFGAPLPPPLIIESPSRSSLVMRAIETA